MWLCGLNNPGLRDLTETPNDDEKNDEFAIYCLSTFSYDELILHE